MDMKQYTPITDKRGKTVHFSALGFKPLCRPGTNVVFHATVIGMIGTKLCATCAERELRVRYEKRAEQHANMTVAEQLDNPL